MSGANRLEVDGEVTPADAVSDLAGWDWTVDGVVVRFRPDGTVTCIWEAPYAIDEARRSGEAILRGYLAGADLLGDLNFGGLAREFSDTGESIIVSPPTATLKTRMGRPSIRIGGVRTGPNPETTAWLAYLLLDDPIVAAVAKFLQESLRATRMRTRDDWIAFEIMEHSVRAADRGAKRTILGDAAGMSLDEVNMLGDWLQDERHERVLTEPKSPGFNAETVHRLVHKIFLAWARRRANQLATE